MVTPISRTVITFVLLGFIMLQVVSNHLVLSLSWALCYEETLGGVNRRPLLGDLYHSFFRGRDAVMDT